MTRWADVGRALAAAERERRPLCGTRAVEHSALGFPRGLRDVRRSEGARGVARPRGRAHARAERRPVLVWCVVTLRRFARWRKRRAAWRRFCAFRDAAEAMPECRARAALRTRAALAALEYLAL